jgi:acyl-coenzyme A synthetase/AMP-(fatty) acid ligase
VNVIELADELHARVGDYPKALVYEGPEYSSGELRRMQLRLGGALIDMGVGRGDRVAVITPNCPEVGITYAAVWRIGAVTVPILFLRSPRSSTSSATPSRGGDLSGVHQRRQRGHRHAAKQACGSCSSATGRRATPRL